MSYIADECFLTGTAAEVIPVIKADGRMIGNGKPGRDHQPDDRPLPRDDARERHADFFLSDRTRVKGVETVLLVSCQLNLYATLWSN